MFTPCDKFWRDVYWEKFRKICQFTKEIHMKNLSYTVCLHQVSALPTQDCHTHLSSSLDWDLVQGTRIETWDQGIEFINNTITSQSWYFTIKRLFVQFCQGNKSYSIFYSSVFPPSSHLVFLSYSSDQQVSIFGEDQGVHKPMLEKQRANHNWQTLPHNTTPLRWQDTKINNIHDFSSYHYFQDQSVLGSCFCL